MGEEGGSGGMGMEVDDVVSGEYCFYGFLCVFFVLIIRDCVILR